jgi:hypothetical protein
VAEYHHLVNAHFITCGHIASLCQSCVHSSTHSLTHCVHARTHRRCWESGMAYNQSVTHSHTHALNHRALAHSQTALGKWDDSHASAPVLDVLAHGDSLMQSLQHASASMFKHHVCAILAIDPGFGGHPLQDLLVSRGHHVLLFLFDQANWV